MKSTKNVRTGSDRFDSDDLHKSKKLSPIKKSGKERHALYSSIEEDEDDLDYPVTKRESVLDYFDDEEEDYEEDDYDEEDDEEF